MKTCPKSTTGHSYDKTGDIWFCRWCSHVRYPKVNPKRKKL